MDFALENSDAIAVCPKSPSAFCSRLTHSTCLRFPGTWHNHHCDGCFEMLFGPRCKVSLQFPRARFAMTGTLRSFRRFWTSERIVLPSPGTCRPICFLEGGFVGGRLTQPVERLNFVTLNQLAGLPFASAHRWRAFGSCLASFRLTGSREICDLEVWLIQKRFQASAKLSQTEPNFGILSTPLISDYDKCFAVLFSTS